MKLFLALLFSLFTSAAVACTDFSGTYKDEANSTYTVVQSACASVVVNSGTGTDTIIADGQYRLSEENDQLRIYSAGQFIGANFTVDSRFEYKISFPPEVPADRIPATMKTIYTLDSARNLVMNITIYNSKNQVIAQMTSTHRRV